MTKIQEEDDESLMSIRSERQALEDNLDQTNKGDHEILSFEKEVNEIVKA